MSKLNTEQFALMTIGSLSNFLVVENWMNLNFDHDLGFEFERIDCKFQLLDLSFVDF